MAVFGSYDPIGSFYDAQWADRYHPPAFEILKALLGDRVPPGSSVLDLCCGTGEMSRRLAGEGYEVSGIDISGRMIEKAKGTYPERSSRSATHVHSAATGPAAACSHFSTA